VSGGLVQPMLATRPSPWAGAVIVKLTPIRSGSPLCFFSARFPLLELTLHGCALWRTRAGRLWCSPPKQKRVQRDGVATYDDIVEFDGGGPASRFSSACIEAIQRYAPELLAPLIEGHAAPAPLALPPQHRDRPSDDEPASAPSWWEDRR
jgi:hypothetical protein